VFISSVSLWEIWLKVSLNKLQIPKDFESRLAEESFEIVTLTPGHAQRVASLPWLHRDPFDRMLIAQAQVENLIFVTADEILIRYGDSVKSVR
jgi:PIN domain nuclease of toxin-antitoxin system